MLGPAHMIYSGAKECSFACLDQGQHCMSLPWFVQGYLPAVVREQYSMVLDLSYVYIEIVLPVQLAKHFFVKLITKKCRRTLISVNAKH